ncbi:MAG: hypothetical protein R2815_12485 [Flavobacteriales bacterium]
MNRGILFAGPSTLVLSALLHACRPAPAPDQLRTLDSLNTTLEAARSTLAELDRTQYTVAAERYAQVGTVLEERFKDTLDPSEAERSVSCYLAIRSAREKGLAFDEVQADVRGAQQRLAALEHDLMNGAIDPQQGRELLAREVELASDLDGNVRVVIADHTRIRRALDTLALSMNERAQELP